MGIWFQCTECIFGSNSHKHATSHADSTGHAVKEEKE